MSSLAEFVDLVLEERMKVVEKPIRHRGFDRPRRNVRWGFDKCDALFKTV